MGKLEGKIALITRFTRTWTTDLKDRGIRVNAVSPGSTDTPGLNQLWASSETGKERWKMIPSLIPLGRMGTADEIANAVLPGMRRRHRGRIINLASRAGIQGIPTLSAYVTSKAALIRFSEALALETIEDGIQVFAIHPGTLRTPMNDYVHDSPEVAKSAPQVQQRFRTVYAQGLDTMHENGKT